MMTEEEIAAEQALLREQAVLFTPAAEVSDVDAERVTPLDLLHSQNYTDRATRDSRYAACKGCERFVGLTKQCRECLCFMPMKTWLSAASCPIGEW